MLAESSGSNDDVALQSVPTIKVSDDLDVLNEIINDVGDDRNNILSTDKVVLVVEDDINFGKIMLEKAHEMDLKAVIATNFSEVFDLTNKYNPIAITLDVNFLMPADGEFLISLRTILISGISRYILFREKRIIYWRCNGVQEVST